MMRSFPNGLTLVVVFILVAMLLTILLPRGAYDRVTNPETGREVVVPGTFHYVEDHQSSAAQWLTSIPRGILSGGEVVVLILLVGASLYVVDRTGALRAGVAHLVVLVKGREIWALWIIGALFLLGGIAEGLEEEIVPMIPVLLFLTRQLKFPAVTAIGISFGSSMIGAAFSPMNPFGAMIANRLADLPMLTDGWFYSIALLIQFIVWMAMMSRHAVQNKTSVDETNAHESAQQLPLTSRHMGVLAIVALAFSLLVSGMVFWDWGFNDISAEFFVVAILAGWIGGLRVDESFKLLAEGFKEMIFAAMIVGFAYAIPLVLREGMVMDTIIHGLFTPLQYMHSGLAVIAMLVSQAALHVLIPSYSGQAVFTIPILAPLCDMIGLSRSLSVASFQFGAIPMNLVAPTNGALMAIIAMAGVSYKDWLRFVVKRLAIVYLVSSLLLLALVLLRS